VDAQALVALAGAQPLDQVGLAQQHPAHGHELEPVGHRPVDRFQTVDPAEEDQWHVEDGTELASVRQEVGLFVGIALEKPPSEQLETGPHGLGKTAGLRVEPLAGDDLEERNGRLLVPQSGAAIDDELVRGLRDADQR
jgi:hypothetical protein